MATLTADRHFVQRSLLDPHEEERDLRTPQPQAAPPAIDEPRHGREARAPRHVHEGHDHDHDRGPGVAGEPGPTLDDLVAGTWDALLVSHAASCFFCGGDLAPRWSAGPRPVGGRCTSCGSELS